MSSQNTFVQSCTDVIWYFRIVAGFNLGYKELILQVINHVVLYK